MEAPLVQSASRSTGCSSKVCGEGLGPPRRYQNSEICWGISEMNWMGASRRGRSIAIQGPGR